MTSSPVPAVSPPIPARPRVRIKAATMTTETPPKPTRRSKAERRAASLEPRLDAADEDIFRRRPFVTGALPLTLPLTRTGRMATFMAGGVVAACQNRAVAKKAGAGND